MGKKKSRIQKVDYWDSILDMPIYNWFMVEETNDLSWLLKYRIVIGEKKTIILSKAWDGLISQYIDRFGISDSFLQICLIRKAISVLRINEVLLNQNNTTFIEIETEKLKNLSQEGQKQTGFQVKAMLERNLKFRLDPKQVTVVEYFTHLEEMNRDSSRDKAA